MTTKRIYPTLLSSAVLLVFATTAQATPFTANPADTLGPLNGGSVTYSILSPGASANGAATLTFDLLGYLTVDGAGSMNTDTFTLSVNDVTLFRGAFNMGGGGSNTTFFSDPGVTIVSTENNGLNNGGLTQFSVAHTLLSGNNSYVFDYGVMQGPRDEGWGLRNLALSAEVNGNGNGNGQVPEPASLALLGIGLAGLAAMRRRKT